MNYVNSEKREEHSRKSPFKIYYGKKSNQLVNDGKSYDSTIGTMETVGPSCKDFQIQVRKTRIWREKANKADERMSKRMHDKHARNIK